MITMSKEVNDPDQEFNELDLNGKLMIMFGLLSEEKKIQIFNLDFSPFVEGEAECIENIRGFIED